jgi:hypothetical protein
LLEDLLLESLQVPAGFEPEFLDQPFAHRAIRGEGISLPSCSVQRGDQQRPKTFAERMSSHELLQLADDLPGRAEIEPRPEAVFDQPKAQPFELGSMRSQPVSVAGAEKALPSKQRQRGRGCLHHGGEVAGVSKRRDLVGPSGDLQRVDRGGIDRERVAHLPTDDQGGVAQRASKP